MGNNIGEKVIPNFCNFLLILFSRSIGADHVIKNELVHVPTENTCITRDYIKSTNGYAPSQNFWWEGPRIKLSQ